MARRSAADALAIFDMVGPMALRVAATLRLADELRGGPRTAAQLAEAVGAAPDGVARLASYLVSLGILREDQEGCLTTTVLGRLLEDDHPSGMRRWLDMTGAGGRMDQACWGMLEAVRRGGAAYRDVMGCDFWDDMAADARLSASFADLMAAKSRATAAQLPAALGLEGVSWIVDVGGGDGTVLSALLAAAPAARGTVLELGPSAARARSTFGTGPWCGRAEVVEGSFFDGVPDGADLYLLVDILHDWDDADAARILSACAGAGGAGGRVVVVEELLGDPPSRSALAMDVKMLTLMGGRQRSMQAIRALAEGAGLRLAGAHELPSGMSSVELVA